MKIVINPNYGIFMPSHEVNEMLSPESDFFTQEYPKNRTAKDFVEIVEKLGNKAHAFNDKLVVVEFPDEATDYDIIEYDGAEYVVYVLDGKLHYIHYISGKENKN